MIKENNLICCDIEAERGVLSGIFNEGYDVYCDISDIVNTNTFTNESHQFIWKVFDKYFQENKDPLDLPTFISTAGYIGLSTFFNDNKQQTYLRTIISSPINQVNIRKLGAKIRKLQIARSARVPINQIESAISSITGEESLQQIIGYIENPIFDFTSLLNIDKSNGPQEIFEDIEDYVDYLAKNPVKQIGLSIGYPNYEKAIGGGLRRKTVNIICARMKQGKSIFADSAAINLMKQKIKVLMVDTEMDKGDHKHRMLGALSGVFTNEIENGQFSLDKNKEKKVREAANVLKGLKEYYTYQNISGWEFEDIIAMMRRWLLKKVGFNKNGQLNDCVIVYDYIKLMSADILNSTKMQEYQALGFLMTSLHNFAVKHDVPILSFVQLNRDGISREETDIVSGSDRIAWLTSNLTLLKKQSDEEIAEQSGRGQKIVYRSKLVPLVARHGAGLDDGDYININFQKNITKMEEGPLESELKYNYSLASNSDGKILSDDNISTDSL